MKDKKQKDKDESLNSSSANIVPKTKEELFKKKFFDEKDNRYRVSKLNNLVKILQDPNFDIELDELKFKKLQKYKDYSLVKLTKQELKTILSNYDLKEETYLNFLGINKLDEDSYSLQLDLFLDKFIRINLNEITLEENLDMVFKMYDKDNDGKISKKEATDLLTYFNEINLLEFDKKTIDVIITSLFNEINKSKSGSISKPEMKVYLEKFKESGVTLNPFVKVRSNDSVTKTRDKTKTIISKDDSELNKVERKKDRSKFYKFWDLNKKMIIWTAIYVVICITAGVVNRALEKGRQYETTKAARFFAGVIYINFSFLLLLMCTTTITFLSSTSLRKFLPIDDTTFYHEVCGCVMGVAIVIHVLIHLAGDFVEIEKKCSTQEAKKYVTVAWLTFANITGLTGFLALLNFSVVMILPIIPWIRNNRFEIFYYTHKLFYVGIILVVLHANTPDTGRYTQLVFFPIPCIVFIVELVFRFIRYCTNKTKVKRVNFLPSGVILLEIEKPKKFEYKCGQYAQINIPNLSKLQWHPFTFASSPDDDNVYFYISPAGDWTKDLKKLDKDSKGSKAEDKSTEKDGKNEEKKEEKRDNNNKSKEMKGI